MKNRKKMKDIKKTHKYVITFIIYQLNECVYINVYNYFKINGSRNMHWPSMH